MSDDIHVIPVGDVEDHQDTPNCFCNPIVDPETIGFEQQVWVHNRMSEVLN